MSEIDKNLNTLLGIDETITSKPTEIEIIPQVSGNTEVVPTNTDIEQDYNKSRDTLKRLMDKGEEVLDEAVLSSKASQNPEAFASVASLIRAISGATKEVFELHKRHNELTVSPNQRSSIQIDKAVFVGTPGDLLRKIKEDKNKTE